MVGASDVGEEIRSQEQDRHWTWRKLVGSVANNLKWECVALQTGDGEIQGAMIYRMDTFLMLYADEGTIYVDRLATAPRNRDWVFGSAEYRGVGTNLLKFATCHSFMLGLGGRISCVSLPSGRTHRFYEKLGFVAAGLDASGGCKFELSPESAQEWLRSEGLL